MKRPASHDIRVSSRARARQLVRDGLAESVESARWDIRRDLGQRVDIRTPVGPVKSHIPLECTD
eukprot:2138110-Pyramimonas_sp.AAC.1